MNTKSIVIAVLVVLGAAAAYVGLQPAPKPAEGTAGAAAPVKGRVAPDFSLPSVPGGTTVSVGANRGKVVLVNFWATWCPPCRGEVPEFVKVQQELGPKGFQILGLSLDDGPQPVVDFIKAQGINYPVAMGAEMAGPYGGVSAIPSSFLLDREGKLVQHFEGAIDADTLRKAVAPLL